MVEAIHADFQKLRNTAVRLSIPNSQLAFENLLQKQPTFPFSM